MSENQIQAVNAEQFQQIAATIEEQLAQRIVGQRELVHDLLVTLLAGGNALIEGVPGLGKTILIRTLAEALQCTFSRIQFTPDLMPADIVGTMIIDMLENGQRGFRFEKGPIFANLVLADEINRAAPRTQSALLEAMQEQHVTVAGQSHVLASPFFVLATQNPIEMEGTYPLPEAQLDRFLFKLQVPYPSEEDLIEIAKRTTGPKVLKIKKVATGEILVAMQQLGREVAVAENVYRYIARLINATHPESELARDSVKRHLRVGASPRGLQALVWGGKVEALLEGRKAVAIDDVRKVAYPALRHRLILNFEAQADAIDPDEIIHDLIQHVPVP